MIGFQVLDLVGVSWKIFGKFHVSKIKLKTNDYDLIHGKTMFDVYALDDGGLAGLRIKQGL